MDIRLYKGEHNNKLNKDQINYVINQYDKLNGCTFDFGIDENNNTILIEVNDGYSICTYGCDTIKYTKLLYARWCQLHNIPDNLQFKK